jgi:hypothetical protein
MNPSIPSDEQSYPPQLNNLIGGANEKTVLSLFDLFSRQHGLYSLRTDSNDGGSASYPAAGDPTSRDSSACH